ncbi:hypothetical protein DFH28DRAFT_1109214 [Melampsora americana]|nr:hypothetical protein DFH28DRAFT_1109214 [Melampsora americana]
MPSFLTSLAAATIAASLEQPVNKPKRGHGCGTQNSNKPLLKSSTIKSKKKKQTQQQSLPVLKTSLVGKTSTAKRRLNILEICFPNQNQQHLLEDTNLTLKDLEKRKSKKAKQEELEMLKLEHELAQEHRALSEHSQGSGMSKLALGR